jgi:hypothetical protein
VAEDEMKMKIRTRGQQAQRLSFWIWIEYLIVSCVLPSALWAEDPLIIEHGTPQQERFLSCVTQISADDLCATPNSKPRLTVGIQKIPEVREAFYAPDLRMSQPITTAASPAGQERRLLDPARVRLPIRLYWGYLVVVEGSIGNMQKLNFLVDTGAYPSVVDQKIARHLGLAQQPATVNLSTKTVQSRLVVLPSIFLGPIHAESLPVLTEDLSFLKKAVGQKVDGVVGLDVLRKCNFTINYRTKEMVFGAIDSLTFSAPFDTGLPLVTIRTRFQNRQLRLVVDSAGPDLMLFQSRVQDTSAFQALDTGGAADARGTFHRRKVRVPEVYLGTETIGEQIAFVVDDRRDYRVNFDGVLGIRGPQCDYSLHPVVRENGDLPTAETLDR